MSKSSIFSVPTNIITGFLGAGKTTLIQQLLQYKPENERWAVLVNEFGEVGLDGAFFSGRAENGIYIREVPGGCMCCTSGLPMQVALNQLLAKAKPDRLLIEPTGLGHPKEVIESLQSPHYKDVLDLRATLTLVDARKVTVEKWRDHPTFQQQIKIADCIIAAKPDLYCANDLNNLHRYLRTLGLPDKPVIQTKVDLSVLELPNQFKSALPHKNEHSHNHHSPAVGTDIAAKLKQDGSVKITNQGEGYFSYGWVFSAQRCFDFHVVMSTLTTINIDRLKAVFITNKGIFAFNLADGTLSCFELDECDDSRLEFITSELLAAKKITEVLETALFDEKTCNV